MDERKTGSFKRRPAFASHWAPAGKVWYWLRARLRHMRISQVVTRVLGSQYRRSRTCIEIDITYICNLRCLNCNRSCSQAPEALHMSPERVRDFVDESIGRVHRWERIRVLGGEPTLHPQFTEIIEQLVRYRRWNQACIIEVVTNGHGGRVRSALAGLPNEVWVENSNKSGSLQPEFGPFNMAPCDDAQYANADFRNGCVIMEECGMGLAPSGYYPCAVAGGIDRIAAYGLGYQELPPDEDDMEGLLKPFCSLCGRFRDGHFVPKNLRPKLTEEKVSPTWETLYRNWALQRR